ncbi:hypothetical protein ACFX12_046856 [Malus domestica]
MDISDLQKNKGTKTTSHKTKGRTREKAPSPHSRNPKRNVNAAKPTYAGESIEQEPRISISLHEYFPEDFFQQCTIAVCHMVEVEMEEPGKAIATEGEQTLTLEEGLPTHFSVEEALRLPKKIRRALAVVLVSPEITKCKKARTKA